MSNRTDRNRDRWILRGLMITSLILALGLLTACGAGDGEGRPDDAAYVSIFSRNFQPEQQTVAPDTMVIWTNEDSVDHTVTAGTPDEPTDLFDALVPPGGTFEYTFDDAGRYEYFCSIHPDMRGVIIVEE